MSLRTAWTPGQQAKAQVVYDRLVALGPTYDAPIQRWRLAHEVGYAEGEMSSLVTWALREICTTTGIYIGSKRGPGGGYFITTDKSIARDTEKRLLMEQWNHLARALGAAQARQKAKLGNRNEMRRNVASLAEAKRQVEESLAELGTYVGSTLPTTTGTP